ncbi:MAG: WecB/TagA/CpsF family glycosyltransferase [Lachnospiraceae bacterium]|jgi:N-acetylglucosaminyldiphosphoundecaprenol N-acetyl-beta-D-mannosaminyltransferase|nr:WecB/TagA/CpsF family glycosyltransferase [Lachnospiraceae bacterium]
MKFYKYKRNFVLWGKVGFCASTRKECVESITNLPTEPVSATVGFVGIPASIACMENKRIAIAYNNLTYVAVDGMPIIKKCRKAGIICERCSGPDIMEMIIKAGIREGKTHYFYGGKNQKVLDKIRDNLIKKYPDIKIVGMYSPPFRNLTINEDQEICGQINELHPDYVWVGIGQPKQDYWIESHKDSLKKTTILGVGAAFDFIAGSLDRAPEKVQELGFEWAYRFVKEPKRLWNRYVKGGFKYLWYCFKFSNKCIEMPSEK